MSDTVRFAREETSADGTTGGREPATDEGHPPATGDRLEVNPRHFEVDHDPVVVEKTPDREYRAWLTIRDDGTRWEIGVDDAGRARPIARYEGGHRRDLEALPEWLVGVLRYVGVEVPAP